MKEYDYVEWRVGDTERLVVVLTEGRWWSAYIQG